jgi:hypothetical protein
MLRAVIGVNVMLIGSWEEPSREVCPVGSDGELPSLPTLWDRESEGKGRG